MGEDAIFRQFDDIDRKVENLLKICLTLEEEKQALLQKIAGLEQEIEQKNRVEQQFMEQKEEVKQRIDALMEKLKSTADVSA